MFSFSQNIQMCDFCVLKCSLVYGLPIHALSFHFGVLEPSDACLFCDYKNKTEKQEVFEKPEKNIFMPYLQQVFLALCISQKLEKMCFWTFSTCLVMTNLNFHFWNSFAWLFRHELFLYLNCSRT